MRLRSILFVLPGLVLLMRLAWPPAARAATAPDSSASAPTSAVSTFTVPGPTLQVDIQRGPQTLPIYRVPRLQPGDVITVKSSFSAHEAVHWMLIAGFLRGATNPPPKTWFREVDLWKHHNWNRQQSFAVPAGARQALLFLAPETGGGFSTLRSTVRRQPNLFLRVSHDMIQATAEKGRLDSFLSGMRTANPVSTPQSASQRSIALANSLSLKVNGQCFDSSQNQVPCLVQNTDQVLGNSGHLQSAASTLTSLPSAGLVGTMISSQLGAAYFPYVGAFVDVIHLLGAARTANYQYLPALPSIRGRRVQLKLNHDPAFKNPKSVLVYVLPQVASDSAPHIVIDTENHPTCLSGDVTVLPADAPSSLYSTHYGHDWTLTVSDADGHQQSGIPVHPDPAHGGFLVPSGALHQRLFAHDNQLQGTIHGKWGFDGVSTPAFTLQHAQSGHWQLDAGQADRLVTGEKSTLTFTSPVAACIQNVELRDSQGKTWTASLIHASGQSVAADFNLAGAAVGAATLRVTQAGIKDPDSQNLRIYLPPPSLTALTYYAGDHEFKLQGTHLDEVASLEIAGQIFEDPQTESGWLRLRQPGAGLVPALSSGAAASALFRLRDGRTISLPFTVQAPRPRVHLLRLQPRLPSSAVVLEDPNTVPQSAEISMTLTSVVPRAFQPDEKIEVSAAMQQQPAELTLGHGLTLQDQHTLIATFVPAQLLGTSSFGKVAFRVVDHRGVAGAWTPLPAIVRLPILKQVQCPIDLKQDCTLAGDRLYLLTEIAANPEMHHATKVPAGFNGTRIRVPRPSGATLFIRLRDDPGHSDPALLPVFPEMPPATPEP